jgi:hypothetical protein
MQLSDLERLFRATYRIWKHPGKHASRQYRWMVYFENEIIAQFKKEGDAKIFIQGMVDHKIHLYLQDVKSDQPQK